LTTPRFHIHLEIFRVYANPRVKTASIIHNKYILVSNPVLLHSWTVLTCSCVKSTISSCCSYMLLGTDAYGFVGRAGRLAVNFYFVLNFKISASTGAAHPNVDPWGLGNAIPAHTAWVDAQLAKPIT
jgi:hypothetical protein